MLKRWCQPDDADGTAGRNAAGEASYVPGKSHVTGEMEAYREQHELLRLRPDETKLNPRTY